MFSDSESHFYLLCCNPPSFYFYFYFFYSRSHPLILIQVSPNLARGETPPVSLPLEEWNCRTYEETYQECRSVAKGFLSLGLASMDAVAIYGFNSPEWVMAEIAAILAGGCAAGIYPSDTAEQVSFKAKHSGTAIAVVQNKQKADMFLAAAADLPKMKAIVVWDDTDGIPDSTSDIQIFTWSTLICLKWPIYILFSQIF